MNSHHSNFEDIVDYLHRELDPETDAQVMQHLSECADCRGLYEEQARLSESLKRYATESERELPQGVVATIWDRIETNATPSWTQRLAAFLRPAVAVPAALVVALAIGTGYVTTHRTSAGTTIDAAYYLQDHAALTHTVPFNEGTIVPTSLQADDSADQHWVASTGPSFVADAR